MSLVGAKCTHGRHFPFLIRHGRKLIKGQSISLQISQHNPTKPIPPNTHRRLPPSHYILSLQCFSTNPSSLSSLPLPWPLSSPPPQPHRPLAQAIPIRAPIRAPTRAPIKTPINPPLKPPLAAQASPRCAVNPLPHSAICRTLSKLRSKALTPL
jgi:hypothetical protein